MSSILPLPPAIAHGLPWRVTFSSGREPATLDRFAEPKFIESLTRADRQYCEELIESLLARMLKTRHIPRRIGRLRANEEVSLKVLAARPATSLGVALGSTRFTILESAAWIGGSVSRLLKAVEPDPGTAPKRSSLGFREWEYETIGLHGSVPTASLVPPPRARPSKLLLRKQLVNLAPPAASGLAAGDSKLRVRTTSGQVIAGNDLRLGWLLAEANKVCPLDGIDPITVDELLSHLESSGAPDAPELGRMLHRHLAAIEQASVTQEIRTILSAMLAAAAKRPEDWNEESLHWAYGVGDNSTPPFDPTFWGSSEAAQRVAIKLRRRLQPLSGLMAIRSLYSPALDLLRNALAGIRFMGARHLQGRLAPLLGQAHVIGVMHFLTDMVDLRDGAMVSTVINGGTDRATDLFFWVPRSGDALWAHAVCTRAQDLSLAQGAFQVSNVLATVTADIGSRATALSALKAKDCEDIISEMPRVHWLHSKGWGVIQDANVLDPIVTTMLTVAYPKPVSLADAREAIEWVLATRVDVESARRRLGVKGMAPLSILAEALAGPNVQGDAQQKTLALKSAPDRSYWKSRPLELLIVKTLRDAGGSILNRLLYRRLRDHHYDSSLVVEAIRTLPYLYAPTSLTTSLRAWAR